MRKLMFVLGLCLVLSGCSPWHFYRPPMSNLIGEKAMMSGDDLAIAGKMVPLKGQKLQIEIRDGSALEDEISKADADIKLGFAYGKVKLNLGLDASDTITSTASGLQIDSIENWPYLPTGQTFVYSGIRAQSATMNVATDKNLSVGNLTIADLGTLNVA